MFSFLLSAAVVLATLAGVGMIVPQVVRLHRRRLVDGVSGVGIGVGVILNLWWTMYALHGGLWAIVPVSIGGFALYSVMAAQVGRLAGAAALTDVVRGGVAIGIVPLVVLLAGGWWAAGLAIGLSYGVQFVPAAITAIRSSRVGGISPATWSLALLEANVWFVYGWVVGDPALVIGGGGGSLMALVILWRLASARRPGSPWPKGEAQPRSAILRRPTPLRRKRAGSHHLTEYSSRGEFNIEY